MLWEAQRKCPGLVPVLPDFPRYLELSRDVQNIYRRYTDQVEPFGIDECWLDVTGSRRLFGDGLQIADQLRDLVKQMDLTISVGVSFNKIFAKLGSDMNKPDGTTLILSLIHILVCRITLGPAKPIRAPGSARVMSPRPAKLALTPPVVGSVR